MWPKISGDLTNHTICALAIPKLGSLFAAVSGSNRLGRLSTSFWSVSAGKPSSDLRKNDVQLPIQLIPKWG